ncbi:hypothetical protein [Pedobacter westerhofensis]|uniref:hypothetical protein n=1 Tax=Pedobacter westerhofensis TaxID=425512 RepID=UPI00115ABC31|nr:hypothetical protein [Pedobacter westerhofensis]
MDTTQLSNSVPSPSASNWTYEEDEDKMTSKKIFRASVTAKEELQFGSPYDGGSTATLTIRKKRGETDIYLRVSKGQFNSSYDGGKVRARFDNIPAKMYEFSGASSGDSDIIFLDAVPSFLKKIKGHKKLLLEAEFYSEGLHVMEFDISNLNWTH